jgi:hypothetical protein
MNSSTFPRYDGRMRSAVDASSARIDTDAVAVLAAVAERPVVGDPWPARVVDDIDVGPAGEATDVRASRKIDSQGANLPISAHRA